MTTAVSPEQTKKKSSWGSLIILAAIVLLFRSCAFEPFHIPSESMVPNLLVGDYLFVSKYAYGYGRYSTMVPILKNRILYTQPERGDVAVFREPRNEGTSFIKRVIGLPGDTIQVKNGVLHINGTAVPREKIDPYREETPAGNIIYHEQYVETLPNGVRYNIIESNGNRGIFDNTRVYKIPEGFFFAMGDNRDGSRDSRDQSLGMVPVDNLVGRAEVIFLSFCCRTRFWEVWRMPFTIRGNRVLKDV